MPRRSRRSRRAHHGRRGLHVGRVGGPETVDSRIWPRTAAIAERLWSSGGSHRRGRDVCAPGAGEPQSGIHRRDASRLLSSPCSTASRATSRRGRCAFWRMPSRRLGLGTGRNGRPTGTMPLNRFVDACLPESELARSLELAARRFVANPAGDRADAAILRRQFETWAANDALFEPLVENNKLLAEVRRLSKDLIGAGRGRHQAAGLPDAASGDPGRRETEEAQQQGAEGGTGGAAGGARTGLQGECRDWRVWRNRRGARAPAPAHQAHRRMCGWPHSVRSRCWRTRWRLSRGDVGRPHNGRAQPKLCGGNPSQQAGRFANRPTWRKIRRGARRRE
jgi:hypothetical protein